MASQHALVRLAAFDLDGTLLRGCTVCEILANKLGYGERMRELETLTQLDDIRRAREEIATWYENHSVEQLTGLLDTTYLAPGAVEGVQLLRANGVHVAIASLTWAFAVEWFGNLLSVDSTLGTSLIPGIEILHCWPNDKAEWVSRLGIELGCSRDAVAAIGDSLFDVPMLTQVGVPVFVGANAPAGLPPSTLFMPCADIRAVAARILAPGTDSPLPSSRLRPTYPLDDSGAIKLPDQPGSG